MRLHKDQAPCVRPEDVAPRPVFPAANATRAAPNATGPAPRVCQRPLAPREAIRSEESRT